ncbi:MAG TPA: PAS domain S-box protein, partial [Anaerolineales bacterium]|nr:PAS domain S-box protein [Anaerolineales bacterium]
MSKQKTKLQLQQELELAQKRIEELERKLPAPDENEERFSRFFQASPAQMAITDINTGKYLDINKTFLETLEFTREEVLGKTALELNLFFDPDQRGALLGKMKEQGFLRDEDVLVRTKSGGLRHGIFSAEYIQVNSQSFLLTVMNDITERKLAEERLSESEARLKGFLDSAPDAMIIVNAQGKIILANLQTENLFGYKQSELLEMKIEQLIPKRLRDAHPQKRDYYLQNPQHKTTGIQQGIYALRKDGSEFPVEISLSHHKMKNEVVILSAIRDITEKKQAEVFLLKSTQILHESQLMARLGSWTADLKTGIFESSSEDAQLIGWAPGGHSLNELMNIIHPDDREFVQVSWSAALQGGPFDIEYRIIAGDDIRWLRVKASIKFDNHGVPASAIGVTQDITERKQSAILQETVYHIANAAQTTESLQDFFKGIHHHISNVMAARNFYIALHDEEENLLHFVYSMDEKDPIRESMPPDKGLTSHVLRTGESLLYVYNQTGQRIEIVGTQPKVWLGVPLIARNKIIGVMAVQNYSDPHAYGIREQRILEFVSSQVATAIHLKKATDLLQKSQTSLEMALATANLGSWELDIKRGKGMVWSKEMFHLFRRDPARGIPELAEFMEMVHPDDRQRLLNAQEEAFQSGQVATLEYRATPIPGETRHYKVTIQGILDPEGRTIHASGTVLDITEIRQAFEKIQESEEKYRLLFETMVQGVVFQDENGGIIHANPAAERILGLTLDQMQGRTSIDPRWKSIHEDGSDFPGDTHPSMVALKTGKPIHNVTMGVYNPAFDSYNWININATPRFNGNSEKPHQVYATFEDITERKLAENSLLASEKKLKSLIASQTHFVIRINMEGKYVYWNPQFEKEFGWIHEPNGLLHADSTKTICEHHRKRVFDVVQQCVSQPGQVFSVEIDKPARNGGIRTTLWEFMCITDEHNQPSEIQCMGMEITDRKKAEEALRESEAKYRLLAENISDVIWVLDVESSRFRYVSPSVTSLRGYSVEEVMTEDMAATLTPVSLEYLSQVTPERLGKFQQGLSKSYTDEIEQTCKDGSTVWTEVISRYVIDPETNRLEVYGVSRNITERKKAEAAIRLIEKRNTALIEHAPDGIALVDADGMFLFASPSAYRMFGYDAAEIVGTQSREKVHPQDVSLLANLRGKLLSNPNVPQTVEYRFMHKNGEYHWLESTYTNMFDEPSISGIVINFRDVTERKLSEEITRQQSEQIRLLYEASQQLNRTLDLQEIYQTICDFMVTTIPTSTMFISAFDQETQLITCRAYWIENKWLDVSNFPSIPLEEEGKGTQSLVIRTGKAMLLNDFQSYMKNTSTVYQVDSDTNEISSEDDETPEEEVTRSALIVPLKSDGIVRGIIQVSSYRQDAYTENQLKLLESLALHIASAEQNAILY